MANLNFKWGTYANLPTDKVAGTVYVTTDEKSMYIDVPKGESTERIRVQGSVLYYNSVDDFTATTNPPYAQDTLYFFRKINSGDNQATNAIMAYDGAKWVQINTTEAQYDALVQDLASLNGATTGLSTDLGKLTTRVADLETTAKNQQDSIEELQGLVGVETGENSLSARLTAVEKLAGDNQKNIESNDTDITNLNAAVAAKASSADVATELAKKVNVTDQQEFATKTNSAITTLQTTKADSSAVERALSAKVDKSTYNADKETFALKDSVDSSLSQKVNTTVYEADKTAINTQITALHSSKADATTVSTLESTLTSKINDDIKAVNALTYMGTVSEKDDLPSGTDKDGKNNVKIGDMYVVDTKFEHDSSKMAAPGDLYIASGTEDNNGYINKDTLSWSLVPTGYDQSLNPYLKLENNIIGLYNFTNNSLGSVKFTSANTNISFTTTSETIYSADGKTSQTVPVIQLSNQWESFDN